MKHIEEQEYLKEELHKMVRTRYGKLTLAQILGIFEMVKWELMDACPTDAPE